MTGPNLLRLCPSNTQTSKSRGTLNGAIAYPSLGDQMLRVMRENRGNDALLRCSGRIVAGEETWNLYNAIVALQDKQIIVLDLTGISRIDAGGLGILVASKLWADAAGAGLELIASRAVQELLDVTNLGRLFESGSTRPMSPAAPLSGPDADSALGRRCA